MVLLEQFIRHIRTEKRFSPHTVEAYHHDLLQFSDFLRLSELDFVSARQIHVRSWIAQLLEDHLTEKTVNRKLSSVRSFYRYLRRNGGVDDDPAARVRAPKIPRRLPVVVDETKLTLLLDGPSTFPADFEGIRDRLVLELLFGTGIRLAELVGMREADVDFHQKSVKVLGKRNKERIVPLNQTLLQLLPEYLEEKKKQQFDNNSLTLLVTTKGQNIYPKLIYRIVKAYLSHISTHEKRSPHILRHSFATSLLDHGADIQSIKELLGHSSLAATQVYTHNSVERLKSIYKQAHPKA